MTTFQTTEITNKELLDIVQRMALVAEYRGGNTRSHLVRIRDYCKVIARGLGLSSYEVELIGNASQLHDVGQVGVPEVILSKSGELSVFDWEQVKRHPAIGADILSGSPSQILQVGATIALSHHERWDGSGYPQGLRGEEIPLSGRICAVADVFDALTTKRPYKREVPVDDALELINDASGELFDPQVVAAFDENFDQILDIRQYNL